MKTILYLLASLSFTLAFFFAGCSDDSTSTNIITTNPNDSLMFSFDSLVLYSDDTPQTNAYYLYVESCTIAKFHIKCSFSTTDSASILDSTYGEAITALTNNNDTGNGAFYNLRIGNDIRNPSIDQVVTLSVTTPFRLVGEVYLSFIHYPHNLHKYLKAKNFKLFKTT